MWSVRLLYRSTGRFGSDERVFEGLVGQGRAGQGRQDIRIGVFAGMRPGCNNLQLFVLSVSRAHGDVTIKERKMCMTKFRQFLVI
jgi:hypothetical protein